MLEQPEKFNVKDDSNKSSSLTLEQKYKIVEKKLKFDVKRNIYTGITKAQNKEYLHQKIDRLITKGILIGDNYYLLNKLEQYLDELYSVDTISQLIERLYDDFDNNNQGVKVSVIESFITDISK
jgi:hypothetical protein